MKAIGYIRVSTTNQDVLRQTEKFRNYCKDNGYTNISEIIDFGKTSASFERDGFKATYLTFHRKTHNTCFDYQSRFTSTPRSSSALRAARTLNY